MGRFLGFKLTSLFAESRDDEHRKVYLYGYANNAHKRAKNIVKNQKYNVFTFVPIVIFNQFKFFFNLFYLLIALSQFIPALKVGKDFGLGEMKINCFRFLVYIYWTSCFGFGFDNGQRRLWWFSKIQKRYWSKFISLHVRDYDCVLIILERRVLKANKVKIQKPSSKLEVGDIIEVQPGQRIPADLLLLYSS